MVRTSLRVWLLVLIAFWVMGAHAQVVVRLQVLDRLDDRPVPELDVVLSHGGVVRTDAEGRATWTEPKLPTTVLLKHVAFADTSVVVERPEMVVRLAAHFLGLREVEVSARPEIVYESKELHVADVHVDRHGIWVLAYDRMLMVKAFEEQMKDLFVGGRLILLDKQLNEVASCKVPGEAMALHHDLRDHVLVETNDMAYYTTLKQRGDQWSLTLHPFPLVEMRNAILPWTDSIPGRVIGTRPPSVVPEVEHMYHNGDGDGPYTFCTVVDTFMMTLFRSEYKYLNNRAKVDAMRTADELGTDKETVAAYMRGFDQNPWSKPMYSPLFVRKDTVLVFDHTAGRMLKYDRSLRACGQVPLGYRMVGPPAVRVRYLVQDRLLGDVYTVGRQGTYTVLARLDAVGATPVRRKVLFHPFVEHVRVYDGMAYYVYRVNGSLRKRTLYREKL